MPFMPYSPPEYVITSQRRESMEGNRITFNVLGAFKDKEPLPSAIAGEDPEYSENDIGMCIGLMLSDGRHQ